MLNIPVAARIPVCTHILVQGMKMLELPVHTNEHGMQPCNMEQQQQQHKSTIFPGTHYGISEAGLNVVLTEL